MKLEFFFDCSSPWSYLGFEKVQPLAREFGADIVWRPVLVGGIFNAVNRSVYLARETAPAKTAHLGKDLRDWARLAGLTINFPPTIFPINTAKAMRGCIVLEPEGKLAAFARAAFQAYWGQDRDIADEAVLTDICGQIGVAPQGFLQRIADPAVKAALRANTDEAIARGAFGVPTVFLDGDDMYFGSDRMPTLRAAMEAKLAAA